MDDNDPLLTLVVHLAILSLLATGGTNTFALGEAAPPNLLFITLLG